MRVVTLVPLTLAFLFATWLLGWWAVPIVAGAYGLLARRHRHVGGSAALAATLAWAILLAVAATGERFGAVLAALGGLAPVPAAVFVVVTLLGAPLLAWSAATLAAALTNRVGLAPAREPSPAPALDGPEVSTVAEAARP